MATIRRIYVYLLAFAGLGMLVFGAADVLRVLLVLLADPPAANTERFVREQVARAGAAALVGLPVWGLHWAWARRSARASAAERASTLRRLFLYAVLAMAALTASSAASVSIETLLDLAATSRGRLAPVLEPLPFLAFALVVWVYHWRMAAADRAAVGERGGSATLRRWYVYGAALVGLLALLSGCRSLIQDVWEALASPTTTPPRLLLDGVPAALVGLALWLAHWRWASAALEPADAEADRTSTLRSVYLFLALAVAVAVTLFNASQLLYYVLGRALGVERPGGVGGSILLAAAGPASAALAYGSAWLYQRFAIRQQAYAVAAGRPAGVRRLYTYLVALLALVALTVGLGGLLWTLADLATGATRTGDPEWWREQVALYATLILVGLPVWAMHWRGGRIADADEARSLARRVYVYLALIGSMLVLLGSTARVLHEVLNLVLGTTTTAALVSDLARALAVTVVAGGCAAYHWYILRQDARRAAVEPSAAVAPIPAPPVVRVVRLSAPDATALDQALAHLRTRGIQAEPVDATAAPASS